MNFYSDFLNNQNRLIHKLPHYFPIYERHFGKYVNRQVVFWEIGVFKGGSLQMWKKYFGPFATIVGIDINPECANFEETQIHVRIGDQSDTAFLQSIIDEFGTPDVILDDGSHVMEHINKTFDFMFDKIDKNGVYMVEDLCTAYWENYGGGLRKEDTFIERTKEMIDMLNARHNDLDKHFAKTTYSMCFYDMVVVFEKMRMPDENMEAIMTSGDIEREISSQKPRFDKIDKNVSILQDELSDIKSKINSMQESLKEAERAKESAQKELNIIKNSNAWKITKPARAAMDKIKAIKG